MSDHELSSTTPSPTRRLERGIAALRDEVDADPMQALATRSRVLRSLDQVSRRRRRTVGAAAMAAILSTGTLSWAWATGRIEPVMASVGMTPAVEIAPAIEEAKARRALRSAPVQKSETAPVTETAPAAVTEPAPETVTAPETHLRPRAAAPVAETDVDGTLYRRAHRLHFRDNDPAAALAAWDAYLAARPDGRFAVEARYNRALTLVRLGRRDEAAAALRPFARGEVSPAGYRQREARALIAALADAPTPRRTDDDPSAVDVPAPGATP